MFTKLSNKQCAILLAIVAGLFGPFILLLTLNVLQMLVGSMQMGLFSFCVLAYAAYKVVRMINPDNDTVSDEDYV
jgi:hypothetical protein